VRSTHACPTSQLPKSHSLRTHFHSAGTLVRGIAATKIAPSDVWRDPSIIALMKNVGLELLTGERPPVSDPLPPPDEATVSSNSDLRPHPFLPAAALPAGNFASAGLAAASPHEMPAEAALENPVVLMAALPALPPAATAMDIADAGQQLPATAATGIAPVAPHEALSRLAMLPPALEAPPAMLPPEALLSSAGQFPALAADGVILQMVVNVNNDGRSWGVVHHCVNIGEYVIM